MCFLGMAGLPIVLPDFFRQNSRNFRFLHRITVPGLTRTNSERQSFQTLETRDQKSRSRSFNRGPSRAAFVDSELLPEDEHPQNRDPVEPGEREQTEGLSGQDHQQYVHVGSVKAARRKYQVESRRIEFLRTTGLHATEAAGAQHTIQLAYQLLSQSEEAPVREILDNVIVMLWPSLNPDGQEIVVNWYRSNLGTPYEVAPLVELYQKYVGHDNNRDAYMLNMVESRVLTRTWQFWEPQIIFVHHQTAPFPTRIWLPPFADPIASRTPPLMSRTVNTIGMAIAEGLESRGLPGATHKGTRFDAWYPGYIDFLPMFQHRVAFWTETALYRYATPRFYTVSDFPEKTQDLRTEALYPSPWKGGWWRLRDAVDYMRVASLSALEYAAKYKDRLLFNRYQSGSNTILKYRQEPPFGYFIPRHQRDPVAAVEMLRRLAFNGIRVFELTRPVTLENLAHPAGSWLIPMDQEFAELVRELFQVQRYPDLREYSEGPLEQTFDASGWTLPFQMDVRVIPVMSPLTPEVRSAMSLVGGTALDWEKGYGSESDLDLSSFDSVSGPVSTRIRSPWEFSLPQANYGDQGSTSPSIHPTTMPFGHSTGRSSKVPRCITLLRQATMGSRPPADMW